MTEVQESFETIKEELAKHEVVLFMKGSRSAPRCGFSSKVVGILDSLLGSYHTVDVLNDSELRENIKKFSDWPTIPQLYIKKEFIGGCDLVEQLYSNGELQDRIGVIQENEFEVPEIHLSDEAAEVIRQSVEKKEDSIVHLAIDGSFNHDFKIAPRDSSKCTVFSNGVEINIDQVSAKRASGLRIGMTSVDKEYGFEIFNPNVKAGFKEISVEELKDFLDTEEKVFLFDVRTVEERQIACIENSIFLDEKAVEEINQLKKDSRLVFYCHSGIRSQEAAKYFYERGFTESSNLVGGIDAWSLYIDPSVPRY